MATKEYNSVAKFVRTPDGSCRTIERDKRERRVPIRYQVAEAGQFCMLQFLFKFKNSRTTLRLSDQNPSDKNKRMKSVVRRSNLAKPQPSTRFYTILFLPIRPTNHTIFLNLLLGPENLHSCIRLEDWRFTKATTRSCWEEIDKKLYGSSSHGTYFSIIENRVNIDELFFVILGLNLKLFWHVVKLLSFNFKEQN